MKKIFYLLIFTVLVSLSNNIEAKTLEIGKEFAVEKLPVTSIKSDNKIVVFIPSLTEYCEYASMLTQSFYYYFDQKLAFENSLKSPNIQIILVVNDKQNEARSVQNIIGKMDVVYDETGKHFDGFGISKSINKNSNSIVVLLDSANKIALIDKNYRSQGEHLKPLENKLRFLNGIYQTPPQSNQKELKIGDKAPNFQIKSNQKLSDLRGEVVLLSFYPAAFSGILPKKINSELPQSWKIDLKIPESDLMSCATQIDKINLVFPKTEEVIRVVISGSTEPILEKWQEVLGTENITYANDADYSVSLKYGSYNSSGYNNRVSIIIDRKGRIAYIDKNFGINSEKVLNEKLENILSR